MSQQPDPASLHIDAATYRALEEFRTVASEVIGGGEHLDVDTVALLALRRGLDALLSDVVSGGGKDLVLRAFERLAADHPELVYPFVAERLKDGDMDQRAFVKEWRRMTDERSTVE